MKEKKSQSGSLRDKWGQKWEMFKDERKQVVYIVEFVENVK